MFNSHDINQTGGNISAVGNTLINFVAGTFKDTTKKKKEILDEKMVYDYN
jgi:hypothetical protein